MRTSNRLYESFESWGTIIYYILMGLTILTLIKFIGWLDPWNEITAYPVQCKEKIAFGGNCKNLDYVNNKTTYKVLSSRQEVLNLTFGPDRYTDCAVNDKNNWKCTFNDKSGTFGFTNGRYWDIPNPEKVSDFTLNNLDKEYYVSKFEYIKLSCEDITSIWPVICYPLLIWLD